VGDEELVGERKKGREKATRMTWKRLARVLWGSIDSDQRREGRRGKAFPVPRSTHRLIDG
jgi:hypothetical protein